MTASGPGEFDIIVVGAGVAGVSSAIEAARGGARVALVDARERIGGTAGVAGGGTCIAGSQLQHRLGLEDSVNLALEDWVRWGGDSVDVGWAERYLRDSVEQLYQRLAALGVNWVAVQPREGNRVARWHQPEGGGAAVMRTLTAEAERQPALTFLPRQRLIELVRAGGSVAGIHVRDEAGDRELRARAVVLATGGFNNNADMVEAHAGVGSGVDRVLLGGGLGAVGEGHALLKQVGAQFTQLDAVWMFPYGTPDYRNPDSHRGLAVRGIEGDLWVNDDGLRFHDETRRGGATGTAALLAQPGGRCWSVIDAQMAARLTVADPHYRDGVVPIRPRIEQLLTQSPHVHSAPTLAELAARTGVDAGNLTATVAAVNSDIASGRSQEAQFGKPLAGLGQVATPPFYAIRFHPVARKNLGGVRTDLACRVLDGADRPIAGLFAAGEVAGMAGGRINGRAALEGTSFGPSMYSGLVAGRSVLED